MNGIELITKERKRQIEKEGWTAEHDDEYELGELASVAVCYASPYRPYVLDKQGDNIYFKDAYPLVWDSEWDKRKRHKFGDGIVIENKSLPTNQRIRNLVKAGALIAAEIDRLQRIK
jgi:hypothetical protein